MGPPPRGLAAEANDCFMVRPPPGPTEYKVAARSFARMACRTLSDDHAHRGANDYRSARTFAVKPRAFGAPLSGFEA